MGEGRVAFLPADFSFHQCSGTELPSFGAGVCVFERTEPLYTCLVWQSYGVARRNQ